MGILEWGIIAGALVFVFVCVGIFAAYLVSGAMRGRSKGRPLAPQQRSSMFDALDAGGPGAQAKIESAMVDYAVREKLRQFSEATSPLTAQATTAPKAPDAPHS